MLKEYYYLTKPGIVYGNLFSTFAAYLYAARWHIAPGQLVAVLVGLGLVVASACVFNNYIDRDIDAKMSRTKSRALVSGAITVRRALVFGAILIVLGISILVALVNILSALIAALGFVLYVFIYTFSKRTTHWATEFGSIAGAVPIAVGYIAAADRLDIPALILFLALVFWQMPHFYAIAIYRLEDYKSAGIPTLPATKGIKATKFTMLAYIVLFLLASTSLAVLGFAGAVYFIGTFLIGLAWLYRAGRGLSVYDDVKWARQLFLFSLAVLIGFCVLLSIGSVLP